MDERTVERLEELELLEARPPADRAAVAGTLRQALEDGSVPVRARAAALAADYLDQPALLETVLRTAELDPGLAARLAALSCLGRVLHAWDLGRPGPSAAQAAAARRLLEERLASANPDERRTSLEALAWGGSSPALRRALEATPRDDEDRRAALTAMGRTGEGRRFGPAILAALADPAASAPVRAAAARAAAEAEVQEARPALLALLRDRQQPPGLRAAAAGALGRLAGPAAAADLLEFSDDRAPTALRYAARRALVDLDLPAQVPDGGPS